MRSKFAAIADVGGENSTRVRLAEDEDVIEAFAADRADQSLRLPILPGRARGGRVIAYTRKTLRDRRPVGPPISVSDHVAWCFIPRKGIGDLTDDPIRR
jgi:hypothetical protein